MKSPRQAVPRKQFNVSLHGQRKHRRDRVGRAKSLESSLCGHIFLIVPMRHRKISIEEERMSFVTEVMKVFRKNQSLGDQIVHNSRTVSPISKRKSAFNSPWSITCHPLWFNRFQRWNREVKLPHDNNVTCQCLHSENIAVFELVERNRWSSLDIDTYSNSSWWHIWRYR